MDQGDKIVHYPESGTSWRRHCKSFLEKTNNRCVSDDDPCEFRELCMELFPVAKPIYFCDDLLEIKISEHKEGCNASVSVLPERGWRG